MEAIFEVIITEKFPQIMSYPKPRTDPRSSRNTKQDKWSLKTVLRHSVFKWQESKDNEKSLKSQRENTLPVGVQRITSNFSETKQARNKWNKT